MLQYLVVLLDDTSISYCHYQNQKQGSHLMPIEILREGIFWGMKENLRIQFVYPDFELPNEYKEVINTIDHIDIGHSGREDNNAEILVYDDVDTLVKDRIDYSKIVVLRLSKLALFEHSDIINILFEKVCRLNIIITDVESFKDDDFNQYREILSTWGKTIEDLFTKGKRPQFNILTDRIMLDSMNNCGAGDSSITLAPDGNFYVCPAFYQIGDNENFGLGKSKYNIGSLKRGLNIKNSQLYKIDFAPICFQCDAFHCQRCVWLNRKLTYELNTPGRQQCLLSHIERNCSKLLLEGIKRKTNIFESKKIVDIDYLDPFDKL